jgi:hypothetical protein
VPREHEPKLSVGIQAIQGEDIMPRLKRALATIAVVGAATLGAASAGAVTTFDTSLALPATGAPLGWYNGTGNPQGGFTVVTDNVLCKEARTKFGRQVSCRQPGLAVW